MKLFVTITDQRAVSAYIGAKAKSKKSESDEEAQLLELKIAFPQVKGNLQLWKNIVEKDDFYGLWVNIDHDKSRVDYFPLMRKDYDALVRFFKE